MPAIRQVVPQYSGTPSLADILDLPDWTRDALCAQVGGDEWFPDKGQAATEARRICHRCPAMVECREWAIERHEPEGIWGGLSPRQRMRVRLDRAAAAAQEAAA